MIGVWANHHMEKFWKSGIIAGRTLFPNQSKRRMATRVVIKGRGGENREDNIGWKDTSM